MPTSRRGVLVPLLPVFLAALAACGSDPTSPRVGAIVVEPSPLTLLQHESRRLQVSVLDGEGRAMDGVALRFATDDPRIVEVSDVGEVRSVGQAGATTISVSSGDVTRQVAVTVVAVATDARVTPNPVTIPQFGAVQLRAAVLDRAGAEMTDRRATFHGLSPSLLQVDADGLVTSLGPTGLGRVVARSGGVTDTVDVTVTPIVSGLRVAPVGARLGVGGTLRLSPIPLDALGAAVPATGLAFTFTSANPAVAAVDADGTVRAGPAPGETSVEVRGAGLQVTVPVRVVVEVPRPTGVVVGRIAVPEAFGVGFAPDGVPYAVTSTAGLFRLDVAAQTATSVSGATGGLDVVVSADGRHAFVANQEMQRVDLVELSTGTVVRSSPGFDDGVLTTLLSPDDGVLWAGTGASVVALDATTLAVRRTIPTGSVVHLARHPSAPRLYASDNHGRVHEIDMTTQRFVRTIAVPGWLQGIVVDPAGTELYVANEEGGIRVVDLGAGVTVGEFGTDAPTATGGYGMAISADGLRLYVALYRDGQVAVIDPFARVVLRKVNVGERPRRLALSPAGDLLLVALESGGVVVIR